jgi:hypothetical protein
MSLPLEDGDFVLSSRVEVNPANQKGVGSGCGVWTMAQDTPTSVMINSTSFRIINPPNLVDHTLERVNITHFHRISRFAIV